MGRKRAGKVKAPPPAPPKKPAQEVRADIKYYIQNRDSIGQKWKCLEEAVHSEDMRRTQFYARKQKDETRELPKTIQMFIRTLKRAVHLTMRHVGGTPFSIVRQMFLHWDTSKRGALSVDDLDKCMKSLGVALSFSDRNTIVSFYSSKNGSKEMSYYDLLEDIQRGEPGMLDVVDEDDDRHGGGDDANLRFKTREDDFAVMPQIIVNFIDAIRSVLATKLRNEGGTPYSHLRNCFLRYDSSYASALSAEDLKRAMILVMGLNMTKENCDQIVKHYDRKGQGALDYKLLLADVCKGMPDFMTHKELTTEDVMKARSALETNTFIPKDFKARSNRTLEKFKSDVHHALHHKICACGGTVRSWIKEAFSAYDRRLTGKLYKWQDLQGAMKRNNVSLSHDEAMAIFHLYDRDNTGEMHYNYVLKDLTEGIPTAVTEEITEAPMGKSVTSRAPAAVTHAIRCLGMAVQIYNLKSKGNVEAKDVLMGTFIRFDSSGSGRITIEELKQVFRALQVNKVSSTDFIALMSWFDTNGSGRLDYHELNTQLNGEHSDDLFSRRSQSVLTLPSISKSNGPSSNPAHAKDQIVLSDAPIEREKPQHPMRMAMTVAASAAPSATDSRLIKEARKAIRTKQILGEKFRIESKIAEIEKQKKALMEAYRSTHGN